MEEIYTLLEERFSVIEDLDIRINRLEENKDSVTGNLHIKPSEIQDVSHIIHQLKRNEKLRNIKENDYLEIVFGLRNFDVPQRMRFQEKSYEIMKKIKLGFVYEKYKHTGETKDIAKLYLNFFLNMKLQSKVDDLKRAYANNKFIGYPIVSILLKWLVEVTRKNYQDLLRIKSEQLTVIGKANKGVLVTPKSEKAKIDNDRTINHENQFENPQQAQMNRIMNDIIRKNAEMKDNKYILPKINDSQMSQMNDTSRSKTIELRISSDHMKNSYRNYLDQKIIRGMDENMTSINNSTNLSMTQNNSFLTVKNINGNRMIKPNVQGNCIQLFIQHNQMAQNLLDPIEDLDVTSISTVYQIIHLYRQVRKIPGGNLIMIDLDKKKEMMSVVYKNLYFRNNEIERTMIYYQNKMKDRGMVDFTPAQPRKSDNYLETCNIDFMKLFSHMRGNIVPLNFNENNIVRVNKTQVNMTSKATAGGSQKKITSSYLENPNASQHLTLTPHEDDRFDTSDKSVLKNEDNQTLDKVNGTPQHENQFRITRNRGPNSEEKKRVIRTGSWRQTVDDKSNLFQKTKDSDDSISPIKLKQVPKANSNEKYRSLSVNKMDAKNEPLDTSAQLPKQSASPEGEMKLLYVGDINVKNFKTSDLIPRAHDEYKSQSGIDESLNLDVSPQRKAVRPPSGPNNGLKNILDIKETQDEDDLQSDK